MMWLCRLRHAGKQNDIAINELATDSYTQVDVEVSWIPTQLEGFTFSLIAEILVMRRSGTILRI